VSVKKVAIEVAISVAPFAILFFAVAGMTAHRLILANVLPNYCGGDGSCTPQSHQYVFPGDEIGINLGERSLNRHHRLDRIRIYHLNKRLEVSNSSGEGPRNAIRYPRNVIRYKESLSEYDNVGWIDFEVPDNEELYGKSIIVNYKARFLFPIIISSSKFKWGARNISGEIAIKIGTQQQERKAQNIFYIILITGFLMVILTIFLSPLAYFSRKQPK